MSSSIDQVLRAAVESGAVPNVAAVAADRSGVIYQGAAGPKVPGGGEPVTVDTHFRVMSMTKMVATVVAQRRWCPTWVPASATGSAPTGWARSSRRHRRRPGRGHQGRHHRPAGDG
ncbi:MAG: serine hydrolase [Pseudonocardia sp.]